ncbi:uncharacterized protein LOC120104005 [Phoenix dactylifera]|uniref:Uncharacterized protein LOC120104005 n=1 Tax=Phoenix dactylifera TaxID=42345 RepID=A0A8B9A627_PHODC|nr:uncharacterized protein LOC120104005 [Phoenix dactylifera]
MEAESNAFYVVRKGDTIGIYKSLNDCLAQISSSVSDPSVSAYKGYSLRKETEEYLASRGLKNALYSMNAVDLKDDLFGTLVPCPFQQPDGLGSSFDKTPKMAASEKRPKDLLNNLDATGRRMDAHKEATPAIQGSKGDNSKSLQIGWDITANQAAQPNRPAQQPNQAAPGQMAASAHDTRTGHTEIKSRVPTSMQHMAKREPSLASPLRPN